jgi:hypothetical protein
MTQAASAQMSPELHLKSDKPSRTKEQKEYDKALDQTYQSTLKEIPDPKKKPDPWGDIRPAPPAAAKKVERNDLTPRCASTCAASVVLFVDNQMFRQTAGQVRAQAMARPLTIN